MHFQRLDLFMLCFSSLLRLETTPGPSEMLNKGQNGKNPFRKLPCSRQKIEYS